MMSCVIGNGGRDEYMAALFSMRSVTTREEFRKTHVLAPNLTVNLIRDHQHSFTRKKSQAHTFLHILQPNPLPIVLAE